MNCKSIFIFFALFLLSCSTNESKKLKKKNIRVDVIERSSSDVFYEPGSFHKNEMSSYPFEEDNLGFFKITKEFFRCKGNPLNPERIDATDKDDVKVYLDCEGPTKHSLPLVNGKEGIYPILIDLLNHIQRKTQKKVVITCGHRCPKHNSYADILNNAKTSKHMIGAEVDFYVAGLEQNPEKVVEYIMGFYKENPKYKTEEFTNFLIYEKTTDVETPPMFNKEIFIKIYRYNEGRDFNNRHPYPYISLQVLWDRSTKQKVNYNWEKANRGYLHW